MESARPLAASELFRHCDPADFTFETTEELAELDGVFGQERAVEALEFGAGMRGAGFNLFVLGPNGIGKHCIARRLLERRAAAEPVPPDRCYLFNFANPDRPLLLTLPAGTGARYAADIDELCSELRTAIPAIFDSEEYQRRVQELQRSFSERQEQAIREVQEEAEAHDIALIMTQGGFTFAPRKDGETIDREAYEQLAPEERERIEATVNRLQESLQRALQQFPKWRKESQQQLEALHEEMAEVALGQSIDTLRERYQEHPRAVEHLDGIRRDVVRHVDTLRQSASDEEAVEPILQRYRVNLLVDHAGTSGAPVVYEDLPSFPHLVGRTEHRVTNGVLTTDFSLIRAGALHRANGGYLVLDAFRVLTQPFAWDALKRALYAGQLKLDTLEQIYSLVATVSLQPEPVPLDVKIVLVGDRMLYYLLAAHEPDFAELFKVEADFEDDIAREPSSQALYARLLATLARRASLRPLDAAGVARVIEQGSRLVEDAERVTLHARELTDLLSEADFHAGGAGTERISAEHVQAAIDAQERRASRVRERMERAIQRDTIHLQTAGEAVGQVNGLAVMQLGRHAFGKGSRITATARLGHGQLIDIEREAKLGGNIHSKAVMIIGNYIGARYAAEAPLSLHASLAFEQNYGGIEGDSASVAEVCALLSAIGGFPLSQAVAVTGSIDQHGRVQAVGGVNEKIEGFFESCEQRGLAEGQGVLLPRANVPHLMLRQSVRDAVAAGRFRVIPIDHVDQALEILTGLPVGERDGEGVFPPDSVNARVEARLRHLAAIHRREAGRTGDDPDDRDRGSADGGGDDLG